MTLNGAMACPDPSAHTHLKSTAGTGPNLQEQASTAALYVTNPPHDEAVKETSTGHLSSAGAATSLKHARANQLPSYPIVGVDRQNSANMAASLAAAAPARNPSTATQKAPEPPKSTIASPAGRAALLANEKNLSTQAWRPEPSSAGSKAAMLAHADASKPVPAPKTAATPRNDVPDPNTAAEAVLKKRRSIPVAPIQSPKPDRAPAEDDTRKKALIAATGAFTQRRARAESNPLPPRSESKGQGFERAALNAATIAHRPSQQKPAETELSRPSPKALQAARIQNVGRNVDREMFTDSPPVSLEVEEKRRQDALKASAISMAKKMYEVQQQHIDDVSASLRSDGQVAAAKVHQNAPSVSSQDDIKQQAMQYISLQDAARKLAAERLAKIQTDDGAAFRDYYGYAKEPPRSRLSVRRGRHRSASEGDITDSDDEENSRRIRSQMSLFSNQVADIDAKKRQKDRESLLAAAQKKVQARMQDMDEQVFNDTGKVSHSMMEEWEAKARARAAADSETRMATHGKVHIGGGKYIDQSEIDAVAAARIQPTLNEINEKAEAQRARDEEIRLDREEQQRQARVEKEREAEVKAEQKRIKDEEKHAVKTRKAEERHAAKVGKDAEKARIAEEKRGRKEEKKHEKDMKEEDHEGTVVVATDENSSAVEAGDKSTDKEEREGTKENKPASPLRIEPSPYAVKPEDEAVDKSPPTETKSYESPPLSPSRADSKGFKSLFSKLKRRSKHEPGSFSATSPKKHSFKGGHALTGAKSPGDPASTSTQPASSKAASAGEEQGRIRSSPSISSLSSDDEDIRGRTATRVSGIDDEETEARDAFNEELVPPPKFAGSETGSTRSPVRNTVFREELD